MSPVKLIHDFIDSTIRIYGNVSLAKVHASDWQPGEAEVISTSCG